VSDVVSIGLSAGLILGAQARQGKRLVLRGLANVALIGHLGKESALRYTPAGVAGRTRQVGRT
jgi:hypothetical protein